MSEESILQMLESGNSSMLWFNMNFGYLLSKYNNMFVAFEHNKVLDADENFEFLIKRLEDKGIDTSNVLIKFVSKVISIL